MIERRKDLPFSEEATDDRTGGERSGTNGFERDESVWGGIALRLISLREVDDAHSTASQLAFDAIHADAWRYQRGGLAVGLRRRNTNQRVY
jgi:hypothetical protein